jgi:hypothetical protein
MTQRHKQPVNGETLSVNIADSGRLEKATDRVDGRVQIAWF